MPETAQVAGQNKVGGELLGTFAAVGKRLFPRAAALADGSATPVEGVVARADGSAADSLSFEGVGFDEEVTEEELLDFLAADLDPVPADPVFREKLREELWEMVSDGQVGRRNDH